MPSDARDIMDERTGSDQDLTGSFSFCDSFIDGMDKHERCVFLIAGILQIFQ